MSLIDIYQNLENKSISERSSFIRERWDNLILESNQNSSYKEIKSSNPSESFRMMHLGSFRYILQSKMKKVLTFCGKMSLETGMPEYGELWDETKCTYYIGKFWSGEKPVRSPKKLGTQSPSSKDLFKKLYKETEFTSHTLYIPPIAENKIAADRYLEYCPCDCCSLHYESADKKILKKHGEGYLLYDDGRFYKGSFHNNKFHGKGFFFWPDNTKYIGEYRFGEKHGKGKTLYKDGDFHIGSYSNSKKHGFGIYYSQMYQIWFIGHYKEDQRNGQGLIIYEKENENQIKWIQGFWNNNKPIYNFKGVRYDNTPIIITYEEGVKISEFVAVKEIIDLKSNINNFCDLEIAFT